MVTEAPAFSFVFNYISLKNDAKIRNTISIELDQIQPLLQLVTADLARRKKG
tara:strand:- start:5 stop:160 length:156 start_codon:yes stop_codon:yes gene_type:complete